MAHPSSSVMHHNSIYYARIVRNLMRLLEASCNDSFYEALPRGGQVWLPEANWGVYPDVTVIAGQPLFHEGYANRLTNPCLLFEVLSEPTEGYDPTDEAMLERSSNFSACRHIPYLQEYVFVHQHEAKVEQFYRATDDLWEVSLYKGLEAVVELNLTDTRMSLADLYHGVAFDSLDQLAGL
ncbi:Uma2 family endonuclease [Phormidium sp. FACHB-1136]|uniref:Uma2 family endonuclease n=1 Tax=Phormidium sp. FACHB-1136 TaxID=2692848 RepID=UPI0016894178|nr:Uma2 family endonuclease [Phormidium sp. FACHB-1136]